MDQAVHYIPQASKNSTAATGSKIPKRRVTMNKDLNVQVQIILVGDDGEQQVGEAYEEWEESMVTECSDDDDDDDDDDNDFESMDEKEQDDIGVSHDSLQHRASHQESTTAATAAASSPSVTQQQSLPDSNTTTSSNSSTSSTSTPPNAISTPSTINNKQPTSGTTTTPVGSLWRLFSRGKKDNNIKPSSVIPARVSSEDADSGSVSSLASSVISEDRTAPRSNHATTSTSNNNNQLAVLRVFAGNVNVGAMYHSMLVDENTSAEQLLIQAMERFHIAQIENKASGGRSSSRTITPTNGSGVEYYLTVKPMNGGKEEVFFECLYIGLYNKYSSPFR